MTTNPLTPVPTPLWDTIRAELQRILVEEPQITSPREGVMLFAEQLFTLWETIQNKPPNGSGLPRYRRATPENIRHEATQLAALSLRFLVEMPNWKQG